MTRESEAVTPTGPPSSEVRRPAVLTLASEDRMDRVRTQRGALEAPTAGGVPIDHVVEELTGVPHLARARNRAAARAIESGADLLIFLDADCVPGPDLARRYIAAARTCPDALLAGPVTYLTEEETRRGAPEIFQAVHPHAARPNPEPGEIVRASAHDAASEYDLFWSLSFAVRPEVFRRIGGFHEGYEGYGGEDTDFAYCARSRGVDLAWIGGAHAFHQFHPVSSPPVEHLRDILTNARTFHARWGVWPMRGWLEAFAELGLARWDAERGWIAADDPR